MVVCDALVTGGAGFIGSSLATRLADEGNQVLIADCLSPYYDPAQKRANLAPLRGRPGVSVEVDLVHGDLDPLLDDVDVVFHQAAQPGVRRSWDDFGGYATANITVTQRLLDAVLRRGGLQRFVYASSSSVYGNGAPGGSAESDRPQPLQPVRGHQARGRAPSVARTPRTSACRLSRCDTSPSTDRQRPDMAFHRLIEAARNGTPFPLYGDGRQVRDFTYVDDVVTANLAAVSADPPPGTVVNVAGGVRRRCARWSSSSESWLVAQSSSTPSRAAARRRPRHRGPDTARIPGARLGAADGPADRRQPPSGVARREGGCLLRLIGRIARRTQADPPDVVADSRASVRALVLSTGIRPIAGERTTGVGAGSRTGFPRLHQDLARQQRPSLSQHEVEPDAARLRGQDGGQHEGGEEGADDPGVEGDAGQHDARPAPPRCTSPPGSRCRRRRKPPAGQPGRSREARPTDDPTRNTISMSGEKPLVKSSW